MNVPNHTKTQSTWSSRLLNAVVLFILLPMAWLFGLVSIGQEIGDRFTRAINQVWSPVLSAGFGTFLLMLVSGFIGMVPCAGWLFVVLLALLAIGGVTMTWFGTRSAPGRAVAPPPVEVPPAS